MKIKKVVKSLPNKIACISCQEGFGWTSPILASVWDEMVTNFLRKHKGKKHQLTTETSI